MLKQGSYEQYQKLKLIRINALFNKKVKVETNHAILHDDVEWNIMEVV